jgi:stage V sporulation protein D (sporulation-specific penicillin-binding protein)
MTRLKLFRYGFFLIMILIVVRLFYWQVIMSDYLTAKAEDQRVSSRPIDAPRGKIFFADQTVLASNQPTYLVFVQPKLLQKELDSVPKLQAYHDIVAQKLSNIFWEYNHKGEVVEEELKKRQIKEAEDDIKGKLKKDLYWVSLQRHVDLETRKKIEELKIEGVGFDESSKRFYPEGSSSAHLLGFIGSDLYGQKTGYFGLEGYYNGELKGKEGYLTEEKDALGLPILIGNYTNRLPVSGKTLELNIDRAIQNIVETKIKDGLEKYGAKRASAVVMDPKTGNILAMASLPSYNPANPEKFPSMNYKNPVTNDFYEPGSTFKVLVMAAAINEGLVSPETKCDICSGPVHIDTYDIKTWNNKYQPDATMTDVIVHSDNTGMVFIARKLGVDKLYDYITKFGFGQLTGVDLQDESTPALRDFKDWKEIDLATASFGQGISVTELQLVRGVAAIANGGKVMEPHVVARVVDSKGGIFTVKPRVISSPISEQAAKTITEMMVQAVDKGESQFYKKKEGVNGFRIAGKTGTAQIAVAGHYDPTKTIASFVGFAPADEPKFIILVKYDEPASSIFGADTAAPTFFQIAKEIFTYYGITPTN